MRDSTIIYRSFYEAIKNLAPEVKSRIYDAIFEYSLNQNEIELDGIESAIFTLIKPQLDANNKRYENGKKGGRKNQTETKTEPKSNQTETKQKPKPNQTETKPEPNVNVNDNDNDNDNVINTTPKPPKGDSIDFNNLLKVINAKTGREFKVISDPVKKKYLARLKEGYTKDDIAAAITNAVKDQFHAENGFKFLTPEFFSRAATIDKHSNITKTNGQGLETGPRRKKL